MAKAAVRGDQMDDIETFEAFVERHMATGKPLPIKTVERRKGIVSAYTATELQVVTNARSEGVLKRLLDSPSVLSAYAEDSAAEATARCKAELRHLEELQMLSSASASSSN